MRHSLPGGRPYDIIIDVSLDEFGVSRSEGLAELVPFVVGHWQDDICSHQPETYDFTGAAWIDLDSEDGETGFQGPIAGKPTSGTGVLAMQVPSVAMLIHKECGHTRRQRNGRLYLPGVLESAVDDAGNLTPAFRDGVSDMFEDFRDNLTDLTDLPGASTAWRVVHVTGHTGTPVPGYPNGYPNEWNSTTITRCVCDTKVATQRRRLRG